MGACVWGRSVGADSAKGSILLPSGLLPGAGNVGWPAIPPAQPPSALMWNGITQPDPRHMHHSSHTGIDRCQ